MARQPVLAVLVVCLIALAGCTGADSPTASEPETNSTEAPSENNTTTSPADSTDGDLPASEGSSALVVFDHAATEAPVVDGGLEYDPQNTTTRRYATLLTADRLDEINQSLIQQLAPNATEFVNETDLEEKTLLVYQETPASSVPDYRLTSIQQKNGSTAIALDNSATAGTADITVETVLVRLPADDPGEVAIRLEDGTEIDVEQ